MVAIDSSILLHLLFAHVGAPLDKQTGMPLEKCKERVDFLLKNLSESRIQVLIPTPVLAEVLVHAGTKSAEILATLTNAYAFKIQSFDEIAAVECALLIEGSLVSARRAKPKETKAKVKFDRQIVAIAKVCEVKTIYSDDVGLGKVAKANGIHVVTLHDLPVPPEPPQVEIEFPPDSPGE
jgi:predicted nucleic acid-binding protein